MRHESNADRIQLLMERLGAAVQNEGRVYFTGGVSAVLFGWRELTVDIDLRADPEPSGFFEAVPALKEELEINIELASPADFIPTLSGWRERSVFIARHGPIDFYHYDFYSQALAKIERWHGRDRFDVERMFESGLIEATKLVEFFRQIVPGLNRFPAIDPAAFAHRVAAVTQP
jgi:hypothetical protein